MSTRNRAETQGWWRSANTSVELGVATTADYQDLDQEPEQVVEEGVEHDRGSIAGRPAGRWDSFSC